MLDRRSLLARGAALGGAAMLAPLFPAWARMGTRGIVGPLPTLAGPDVALAIHHMMLTTDGTTTHAIGINGTVPAPLIRLREGQRVRLAVTNRLDEDSSIHWHGLLVPSAMDGVPGVSFPGIRSGATFTYEFPVIQSGTYWYHSHSGLQEQLGLYGPIVIDPAGPDPIVSDREHVIVLADHSAMMPHEIFRKLRAESGYFNYQKQTLAGLFAGRDQTLKERMQWAGMRMDPTDVSDVTGSTYRYHMNGHGPVDNWTGLFKAGERVRLRFVNASAMTNFNVRIPGLSMAVVQADGQNVQPVSVDEFQIAVAETYDVIVTPEDRAYTIVGEAVDRSGMARGTLAPREGMAAEIPLLRERPVATMKDMGMDMGGGMAGMENPAGTRGTDQTAERNDSSRLATTEAASAMGGMNGTSTTPAAGLAAMPGMAPTAPGQKSMAAMDGSSTGGIGSKASGSMNGMSMSMRDSRNAPQVKMGPGVQTISPMPTDRTGDPPQGLERAGHKVLVYRDLKALERNPDVRAPSRSLDVHLTGNMERYMWSFDGVKESDVKEPIAFTNGERVRINLVNDTMMSHPIHLHGHFFELVTGHADHAPRKHTVNVPPGGKVTFDVTADAPGDWAFHCHMLYHMHAGMMRIVTVRPLQGEAA